MSIQMSDAITWHSLFQDIAAATINVVTWPFLSYLLVYAFRLPTISIQLRLHIAMLAAVAFVNPTYAPYNLAVVVESKTAAAKTRARVAFMQIRAALFSATA